MKEALDAHSGLADLGDRSLNRAGGRPDVRSGLCGLYGPATYYECRYTSLNATRRHRAARHSASSIHISVARKSPPVIGGIAGSTKVNRIGRRTAYAMLVILLVAIVWQVLGSP
jgi:hypothetical protein